MFKRSILAFSALLLTCGNGLLLAAKSPVDEGAFIISGSGMLAQYGGEAVSSKYDSEKSVVALSLAASGFVHPGLAIGWQFSYRKTTGYYDIDAFSVGPRVAYYFRRCVVARGASGNTFPYLAIAYQYGEKGYVDYLVGGTRYAPPVAYHKHSLRFSAGVNYMMMRNLGLTTDLTYQQDFYEYLLHGANNENESKSGRGFNMTLGLSFFV